MKGLSLHSRRHQQGRVGRGLLDGAGRRLVFRQLDKLEHGCVTIRHGEGRRQFGQQPGEAPLGAHIDVRDDTFFGDIAFGGSIGAGESYMRGAWTCDDLVGLVRILLRNRRVLEGMDGGAAQLTRPARKLAHWINRNTRRGARRNVAAHYDLGNEFFRLWLDETMMYSSAMFAHERMSLAEAQRHRLDVICRKLRLEPSDHVVEIGTGWGGFAIHAAAHYGCRVTTTTISEQQYDLAAERIAAAGLGQRVTLLLDDYRDLEGRYDKLVSLEMIEAIGAEHFDTFFARCGDLLEPGGRLLIQAITIADRRYEAYRKRVDFIQRYIFPGGFLPALAVMLDSIRRTSDLLVSGVEDIGLDYARTLNEWRRSFMERLDEIRGLGYPEPFIRMWEFYLCYCEGGFLERAISDVQLLAEKPRFG